MKKLKLNRSTVRLLTGHQARTAAGGEITPDCTVPQTDGATCWATGCQGPTLDGANCGQTEDGGHTCNRCRNTIFYDDPSDIQC